MVTGDCHLEVLSKKDRSWGHRVGCQTMISQNSAGLCLKPTPGTVFSVFCIQITYVTKDFSTQLLLGQPIRATGWRLNHILQVHDLLLSQSVNSVFGVFKEMTKAKWDQMRLGWWQTEGWPSEDRRYHRYHLEAKPFLRGPAGCPCRDINHVQITSRIERKEIPNGRDTTLYSLLIVCPWITSYDPQMNLRMSLPALLTGSHCLGVGKGKHRWDVLVLPGPMFSRSWPERREGEFTLFAKKSETMLLFLDCDFLGNALLALEH